MRVGGEGGSLLHENRYRVRNFDRRTHQPGRHGGAVGHSGLQVLHALIFDFLNDRTSGLFADVRIGGKRLRLSVPAAGARAAFGALPEGEIRARR